MSRAASLLLLITSLLTVPHIAAQSLAITPAGGRYDTPVTITMQATEGYTIHYTFNGNTPTADDALYATPITLSTQCYSTSHIYQIQNCPDILWQPADSVEHIIVLRAALFDSQGNRCSSVQTETYIIENLMQRAIEIPVVSLCIDSTDLFDYDSGIFIPGVHYNPQNVYHSGNYCQRGRDWERPANFTYIPSHASAINRSCGIRIHGNRTRSYQQKGFTLYARKEYGNKQFIYPLFGTDAPVAYKRLTLRPWSAGWNDTGIPDLLCQRIATDLLCDHLLTQPVALFLNGEYWGIYFLQEKPDEHYVEEHYGIDKDAVDLLSGWGAEAENGTATAWNDFYQWLESADLRQEADFQRAAQTIDLEALTDYMLLQVFVSNIDWPANNVRQWSAHGSPWRWIFFDGDAAFASWNHNHVILNQLTCDDPTQTYPSSPFATRLFRKLLANNTFKYQAIDRFYKIVNQYIGDQHSVPILREIDDQLSNEVVHQSQRFGNPASTDKWKDVLNDIERYLRERSVSMPDDFARHLDIDPDEVSIILFPNPSHGQAELLYFTPSNGMLTVEVFSAIGQRIMRQTIDLTLGTNHIQLPLLPPGIYFVRTDKRDKPLRWIVK